MARVGRRRLDEVGPRSAHVAGLPYACYAPPGTFAGARLQLLPPRPGDPEYAALQSADGTRYALTATCAAQALAGHEGALAAFAPLAERMRRTPDQAARAVLDGAVAKIAQAVAGAALAPEVARALGRECLAPEHPEILSSIGAALSLVRAEVARHGAAPGAT